ncbi:MAG: iron chelate uptake ABC transporter family permease subunit [Dehalococcoidia bacterium]|nr:iron chelate uptake ABC transporter family permease subunit [Dehalococcoidia bacterium]
MRGIAARNKHAAILAVFLVILAVSLVTATAVGSVSVPFGDVLRMIWNKLSAFNFGATWRTVDETIIFDVRLPRVLGGALVGAGLATAGVLFQGLLRNPMADPYIIGTSAGAALGATVAMLLPLSLAFLGFGMVPVLAFAGALATVFVVYRLARVGSQTPMVSMLLAGFVVSAMLAAVMFLIITLSDQLHPRVTSVYMFLMGGLSVSGWGQLAVIAPIVVGGVIVARILSYRLNAFALGEEGAAHVGVDVERNKALFLALGSVLTAAAVSISGLIGFVGLVVPHALRLLVGPDHRILVPASALAGAAFLVLADMLARTLPSSGELPVGIITALIGAPVFLYLLRRGGKEYAL